MINRHEETREPPKNQRPPHGNGWSRRRDEYYGYGATVWRLWKKTPDGEHMLSAEIFVSDFEIENFIGGRKVVADKLRRVRIDLRNSVNDYQPNRRIAHGDEVR